MERSGKTHADMAAWLAEQGVTASAPTICRCLAKIRESAPPLPDDTPDVDLEALDDSDEVKFIRRIMRQSLVNPGQMGEGWKEAHSAAKFLWAMNVKSRAPAETGAPAGFSLPTFGAKTAERDN